MYHDICEVCYIDMPKKEESNGEHDEVTEAGRTNQPSKTGGEQMTAKNGRGSGRLLGVSLVVMMLAGLVGVPESQAWVPDEACGYCVDASPGAIPNEADEREYREQARRGWLAEQVARDREWADRARERADRERRHREQLEAVRYPNGRMPKPCGRMRQVVPGLWGSEMGVKDRNGVCRY